MRSFMEEYGIIILVAVVVIILFGAVLFLRGHTTLINSMIQNLMEKGEEI